MTIHHILWLNPFSPRLVHCLLVCVVTVLAPSLPLCLSLSLSRRLTLFLPHKKARRQPFFDFNFLYRESCSYHGHMNARYAHNHHESYKFNLCTPCLQLYHTTEHFRAQSQSTAIICGGRKSVTLAVTLIGFDFSSVISKHEKSFSSVTHIAGTTMHAQSRHSDKFFNQKHSIRSINMCIDVIVSIPG